MKDEKKKGIHIDEAAALTSSKSTIYTVPTGYILEIDELVIQNGGTAETTTLTDESTYKDGSSTYSKTVHKEYLAANAFDDTKDFNVRVHGVLKGVTSTATADVIIKGRLI